MMQQQPLTVSIRVPLRKGGDRPPHERPQRLHLYVDETDFTAEDGRHLRGVGVLSLSTPVGEELIDRALDKLRSDPDRDPSSPRFNPAFAKKDQRTLDERFFHACEDSQNGHSPLAEEINAGIHGNFVAAFVESGTRSGEEAYRTNAMRALLSTLKGRTAVSCTFEQWGHFKELQAKDLIEYMNEGLRQTTYEMTMLRTFYPRIDVTVEGKKNPGLQIADFLLWCLVQREFRPSATKKGEWGDRCGLFRWANPGIPEAEAQWFHCTVNDGAPADRYDEDFLLPYPVGIDDIGVAASPAVYALGERTLRLYATGLLPAHAEHLRADLVRVVGRLDREDVGPEHVRDVATQFLRLFDTVPIYRGIADADPVWLSLMRAKRFFAFALREILLYGGLSDFFATARREYLRDDPSALGLSA